MEALVLGSAVGAAFSELQTTLLNVIKTIARFKSIFNRLEETMLAICPIFEDIERLDKVLDRPPKEIELFKCLLNQGTKLILLCSKIKCWNLYKKYKYSKKLQDFDDELNRFFKIDLQVHQVKGLRQISVGVSDLSDKLDSVKREILNDMNEKLDSFNSSSRSSISSKYLGSSYVGEVPEFVLGLDLPREELKVMLLKDNLVVPPMNSASLPMVVPSVVLLSAPPGCGKTTLANMVCLDSTIKEKFKNNIFFVTVSKTVNIKVIVQRVFQQNGRLDELLEVQSDEDAITQLGWLLNQIGGGPNEDPVLLVLDDVWSPGLELFINKFKFKGIPGYKILVTSRFDPQGFESIYKLKLLNDEDAALLFYHSAFPPGIPHAYVPKDLVNEIIKACRGFPLALNVVGLSLCGKNEAAWRITLDKWSKGRSNIFDSNSELLNNLKTSLDALDEVKGMETLKECFLDLGSFPEDQRIPTMALLDMWVELYEDLDEEGMYTYNNLLELAARNLLNLVLTRKDDSVDLVGYCDGQFVTQHDMLRELAIHQCGQESIELRKRLIIDIGENGLPKKLVEKLKHPLPARVVSISTDESFTSNWHNMQLPEAEALILNFRTKNYTLPQFMEHMDKLKVLIVTNYGFCPAELHNFLVVGCLSSLKRIRFEHVSISFSLSNAFALQLKNLRKISLIMCEIGKSLDSCAGMFPNLEEVEIEYCRDLVELPAELCDIVPLKKISITCCNELSTLPEEIGKLINLQTLRLNSCTKLERLPETIGSLEKLDLLDISDCVNLVEMPNRMGDLRGLRTLNMRGCSGLYELPQSVEELENLMVFCGDETASLWEYYENVRVIPVKEDINLNWLQN